MAQSHDNKYLDSKGVESLWAKITSLVQAAVSTLTTLINGKQDKVTITTLSDLPGNNNTIIMQANNVNDTVTFVRRKVSQLWDFLKTQPYGEAYLTWGGKHLVDSYAPVDASMVGDLGANRTAFLPASQIVVEYSRDGGSTWTDYGLTNAAKMGLFAGFRGNVIIGKSSKTGNQPTANCQLRITFKTSGYVYSELNKFVIFASTEGCSGSWISIDARLQQDVTNNNNTWTNFVPNTTRIGGWSGYNVYNTEKITTYGNKTATQYGEIRFTFGCTAANTSYDGLKIYGINCYGGVGWTTPSQMAKDGHLYSADTSQTATFPNSLIITPESASSTSFLAFKGRFGDLSSQWQVRKGSSGNNFGFHDVNNWWAYCDGGTSRFVINSVCLANFKATAIAESGIILEDNGNNIQSGNDYAVTGGEVYDALQGKQNTLTAGTGLSKSGDTINHSNSVTAKTTNLGGSNAISVIRFDAQGHITYSATQSIWGRYKTNAVKVGTVYSNNESYGWFMVGTITHFTGTYQQYTLLLSIVGSHNSTIEDCGILKITAHNGTTAGVLSSLKAVWLSKTAGTSSRFKTDCIRLTKEETGTSAGVTITIYMRLSTNYASYNFFVLNESQGGSTLKGGLLEFLSSTPKATTEPSATYVSTLADVALGNISAETTLLEITQSNLSTYYNSSNMTLNLPSYVKTVVFSQTDMITIQNITGITDNGHRITLMSTTTASSVPSGKFKLRSSTSGDYRLTRYVYDYVHGPATTSGSSQTFPEGFIDFILYNKVWYSKTY